MFSIFKCIFNYLTFKKFLATSVSDSSADNAATQVTTTSRRTVLTLSITVIAVIKLKLMLALAFFYLLSTTVR